MTRTILFAATLTACCRRRPPFAQAARVTNGR